MTRKLPARYSSPADPMAADGKRLPPSLTDLVQHPEKRAALEELYGREIATRWITLEREIREILDRELPDSDPGRRASHAGSLAGVIMQDAVWLERLTATRPGKLAKALAAAGKAIQAAQQEIDHLPEAARFGVHMRLLGLDLPPREANLVLSAEMVWHAIGKPDIGLHFRMAGLAEIAEAVADTRAGFQEKAKGNPGKPRVDRLTRHTAAAYEDLTGQPAPHSGTGAGPFYRLLEEVLRLAGLDDASVVDAGRRRR
jgi:hypothetical protein